MELGCATWPDVAATDRSFLLALPLGSLEQHGPHLPLDTDTRIAVELALRVSRARTDVLVAPPVAYGASGEHAGFPGTMLINHAVLADVLIELIRSARASFLGLVLISAHGGNHEALTLVSERCRRDGEEAMIWAAAAPGGDAHAGRTETSVMLAIDPGVVRTEMLEAGCIEPLEAIMPRLRAEGVRPISSNGVLGDPREASEAEGEQILASMTEDLLTSLAARWPVQRRA